MRGKGDWRWPSLSVVVVCGSRIENDEEVGRYYMRGFDSSEAKRRTGTVR